MAFAVAFALLDLAAVGASFGALRVVAYAAPVGLAVAVIARAREGARWYLAIAIAIQLVAASAVPHQADALHGTITRLVVEALVFASLTRRGGRAALSLDTTGRVWSVVVIAAVAAICGSISAALVGSVSQFSTAGGNLALAGADAVAILTIGPLVLAGRDLRGRRGWQMAEYAALVVGTLAMMYVGFGHTWLGQYVLPYAPFGLLLLIVVRFDRLAASTLPPIAAPAAMWFTAQGDGPFARIPGRYGPLFSTECYLLLMVILAWLIAAVMTQLERTSERLESANRDLDRRISERTAALEVARGHAALIAEASRVFAENARDPRAVRRTIAMRVVELLGDACVVLQPEAGLLRFAAAEGIPPAAVASPLSTCGDPLDETPLFMPVIDRRRLAAHPSPLLRWCAKHVDVRSLMQVIVQDREQRPTVVLALRRTRDHAYTRDDVQLLRELAERAAIAIDHGQLVDQLEQEVAHRTAAEAALRASEEQFRSAFEHAPLGTAIVSTDIRSLGKYLWVNEAFARLSGRTVDELLTKSYGDITHPDDVATDATLLDAIARGRTHEYVREKRYVRNDGEVIWVRVSASAIRSRGLPPRMIVHVEDITESKRAQEELAHRVLHDALTDLPNRELLHDRLQLALEQQRRHGGTLAVLYLDLDHYKDINDNFGHETGDEVLCEVARRLRGAVRSIDTAARLAGDEFVIVCPSLASRIEAIRIAHRILGTLDEPVHIRGRCMNISASIGIALTQTGAIRASEMLHDADVAMYQAKRHGRRRFEVYGESTYLPGVDLAGIEHDESAQPPAPAPDRDEQNEP